MNENIKKFIEDLTEALEKNGKNGTCLNVDTVNIGLIDSEDKKRTRVYINFVNNSIHLAMEVHLDSPSINAYCDLLRKRQADLPKKEIKEGEVLNPKNSNESDDPDECVKNGIHLINADGLGITEVHADKKHVGLMVSNGKIQQAMLFALTRKETEELIATLQEKLPSLEPTPEEEKHESTQ